MKQLRLDFTTYVLGQKAASRLKAYQVTQTLRSNKSGVVKSILSGEIKRCDKIQIMLDGESVGFAEFIIMDSAHWADLDYGDAVRGGFDSLGNLRDALRRAGYRFRGLSTYHLLRIQFSWLPKEGI